MTLTYSTIMDQIHTIGYIKNPNDCDNVEYFINGVYEISINYEEGTPDTDTITKIKKSNNEICPLTLNEAEIFSALLRFKEDSEY